MALKTRDNVQVWEVDHEAVVYDPDNGMGHVLNATAMHIWTLCDGSHTESDIESALLTAFPDQPEVIKQDVTHAIAQLHELGLLESVA